MTHSGTLRILIASQHYDPAFELGGIVTNAVAIAEGLARRGHHVEVVTSNVRERGRGVKRSQHAIVRGVPVTYLGECARVRSSSLNPSAFRFARERVAGFDVVHLIGFYDSIGPAIARAARRSGVPYGLEPCGMILPRVRSFFVKRLYSRLASRMIEGARAIVVTSGAERRDMIAAGLPPDSLIVRRNGVDLSELDRLPPRGEFRWELGIGPSIPLIVWLGRITPIKNLEQLIEASAGIRDMDWMMALIGPPESQGYLEELRALARARGVAERIRFLPPAYGTDKTRALVDADLFTLVSMAENWGNAALEAIAAGTPVMVTRSCGVAELIGASQGVVVDLGVDAIRDGLRDALTRFGGRRIEKPSSDDLSWEEPVRVMETIFAEWRRVPAPVR